MYIAKMELRHFRVGYFLEISLITMEISRSNLIPDSRSAAFLQ